MFDANDFHIDQPLSTEATLKLVNRLAREGSLYLRPVRRAVRIQGRRISDPINPLISHRVLGTRHYAVYCASVLVEWAGGPDQTMWINDCILARDDGEDGILVRWRNGEWQESEA
jgi:hypothetical protein